jgi:broad specificity phosphatase PhoE
MTTLLLMRHGETDAAGQSLMGRRTGWRLNAMGIRQAQFLAGVTSKLPLKALYASPQERAIETAEFIGRPHGLAPVIADGLSEWDFGEWEGKTFAELKENPLWNRFNTVRSVTRPPGGEIAAEVQSRIFQETGRLAACHPGQTVGLVSHGDPLRLLIAAFLGIAIDLMHRFEIATGSLNVVQFDEWGPRVVSLNRTAELAI